MTSLLEDQPHFCWCFSAGVGRTGTFMALDRLMQHIREHEFVDILGMVSEMRSHRLSMVQTEVRYIPPAHSLTYR